MKHKFSRILCAALYCAPLVVAAQNNEKAAPLQQYYQEGKTLFQEKAYSAAIAPLRAFLQKAEAEGSQPSHTGEVLEAEYMLACSAYEMRDGRSNEFLQNFLDNHPDTPHANRIYALMASNYFFAQDYDNALRTRL